MFSTLDKEDFYAKSARILKRDCEEVIIGFVIEGTQGPTNEGCEGFLPILTTISGAGRRARRFFTSKEFLKGINYSWR